MVGAQVCELGGVQHWMQYRNRTQEIAGWNKGRETESKTTEPNLGALERSSNCMYKAIVNTTINTTTTVYYCKERNVVN